MNFYSPYTLIVVVLIIVTIIAVVAIVGAKTENFSEYKSFIPVKETIKNAIKKTTKDISIKINEAVGNKAVIDDSSSSKKCVKHSDNEYHTNMCLLRRKNKKRACNSIVGVVPFPQDSINNPQNFYEF